MNETIRQFALARGIARGRLAHANHETFPATPLTNRAIATDIVQAARPHAWWLTVLWLRKRYAKRIEQWFAEGWHQGYTVAEEAAKRRRFLAYKVVGSTSPKFRQPGA